MADGSKLGIDKIRSAIADILETQELDSLTSRMVRNSLEQRYSVGLKDRKKEIDELLMSMIQEREERKNDGPTNGTADEEEESDDDELVDDDKPPPKKAKKDKKAVQKVTKKEESADDAEVARKLQESEKGLRTRTRKQPTKRTPKTTTKKSTGEKSRTGFGKMMVLSPDLAKIVGADQMPRSEVVKKMWQIIKERNLTDPKDKRFHICDDELLKVFGKKRVQTFSMMKYLKQHVKDPALIT